MLRLELKAYAKINIGLRVTGRRSDGYHEIETVFQQIDIFDDIVVEKLSPGQIVVETTNPELPTGEGNICFRAAEKVRKASGVNFGVKIFIKKNIPVGAGLGGGSSDAAAVIRGINELFQLNLADQKRQNIARELGADVVFFLLGGTAWATGIGDVLQPVSSMPHFWGVLVYPNIEISTAWAYKNINFSLTKTKKIIKLESLFEKRESMREFFQNDLEIVVFDKYPELAEIKEKFYQSGAFFASMSGSGSSVYGLFTDIAGAENAQASFGDRYRTFLIQPFEKTSITRGAM